MAVYDDLEGVYTKALALTEESPTGCIEFTGSLDKDGYGRVSVVKGGQPTKIKTHVLSALISEGIEELPRARSGESLVVRHLCNNRRCMNPEHVVIGTQQQNLMDIRLWDFEGSESLGVEYWDTLREIVKEAEGKDLKGLYAVCVKRKIMKTYLNTVLEANKLGCL